MIFRSFFRWIARLHWIRFGVRDRLLRAFHNPDTAVSEPFQVPFFGKTYNGNFSTFLDWSVYYYGAYSGEELSLMRDAVKGISEPIIFDVGANVGHHTLFASTIAKQVHAFEPFPLVQAKIDEKIKTNSINNITVHGIGLGNTNESLPYSPPQDCNTGTGSFTNGSSWDPHNLLLPIRVGDDYIESYGLPKPDFIKMDIEGFEPQALKGLKRTLEQHRPIVFFEWSAIERGLTIDLLTLFPSQYTIFSFVSERPYFSIFNKKTYQLYKKGAQFTDGNKVAVPVEAEARLSRQIHSINRDI